MQRSSGLLFRARLKNNEILWIRRCKAVHTIGMRYPIDVYFLDLNHQVLQRITHLKPFRCVWNYRAVSVVETVVSSHITSEEVESAVRLHQFSRRPG